MTGQPQPESSSDWTTFCTLNQRRRAVRQFDGSELAEADVRAILSEALLAPSSGNVQSYELHWVRDPQKKAAVAAACNGQRAAATAGALIVVVAWAGVGRKVIDAMEAYVESEGTFDEKSRAYHRDHVRKFRRILRFAPLFVLAPVKAILSTLLPIFTLLPIGPSGMRHWTARNSAFAAQTLLLAASARGFDSCPMEGFNAYSVAKHLNLPRGAVISVVIALGRRKLDARVEPRWRRPLEDALVVH